MVSIPGKAASYFHTHLRPLQFTSTTNSQIPLVSPLRSLSRQPSFHNRLHRRPLRPRHPRHAALLARPDHAGTHELVRPAPPAAVLAPARGTVSAVARDAGCDEDGVAATHVRNRGAGASGHGAEDCGSGRVAAAGVGRG